MELFFQLTAMKLHCDFFFKKALWHCITHGIVLQGGKQLVGLIANPDRRNGTRDNMDLDGAQSGAKLFG